MIFRREMARNRPVSAQNRPKTPRFRPVFARFCLTFAHVLLRWLKKDAQKSSGGGDKTYILSTSVQAVRFWPGEQDAGFGALRKGEERVRRSWRKLTEDPENIQRVLVGRAGSRPAAHALLARGHVLLEDVPGMGKTVLARSLAKSVMRGVCAGCSLRRTLLPTDVTGLNYFDPAAVPVRVQPGAGVLQYPAGGRDQPGHAPDPVQPCWSAWPRAR